MIRTLTLLALSLPACAAQRHRAQVGAHEVLTLRRAYTNVHVVRLPEGTLLIDAGFERDAPGLAAELAAVGVDPASIDLVVLTHGHADHAGGAGWLRAQYGVPVLAGAADRPILAAGHNDALCPTDAMAARRHAEAQAEVFAPIEADHWVDAPLDLSTLGLSGRVWPVAGHTQGSLAVEAGGALFVGDLLRGSLVGGAATTHFFQCAPGAATAAVGGLLEQSDASTWFVGHFGPLSRAAVANFVEGR